VQKLAEEYHIPRKNTLAIGDGANDLAMMNVAGLGVAFHAKPKVQQQAQIVVNFADLSLAPSPIARVFLRGMLYSSASFCKVFALYCASTTLPFTLP